MIQVLTWAVCAKGGPYDAGVDIDSLWKRWPLYCWSIYGPAVLKVSLMMQMLTRQSVLNMALMI